VRRLRDREAYGLLTIAIIATLMLLAFGGRARIASALTQGAAMILGLWTARVGLRGLSIALATIAVVCAAAVAENGADSETFMAIASIGGLLLAVATIAAIARQSRFHTTITLSTVFAAISIYLLLGLAYAYLYGTIDSLGSRAFFANHPNATEVDYIYFSFVTLTSTGFGDFVPHTSVGEMTTVSESILGQLYLVTVVSIIVANLGRSRPGYRDQ
jgi:hypothetical protein